MKINMKPERQALIQFFAKEPRGFSACGCMGPQAIAGQPVCNGANWNEIKREPFCPCSMHNVEQVEDNFYSVYEQWSPDGITITVKLLGPVGGPYRYDKNGNKL